LASPRQWRRCRVSRSRRSVRHGFGPSFRAHQASRGMRGNEERGHGLADLKGRDPMDRRVEVEKKQRYAQALREQVAANSERYGDHDQDSVASGRGASSAYGTAFRGGSSRGLIPETPPLLPCTTHASDFGGGHGGGGWHNPVVGSQLDGNHGTAGTAAKLAQVQDLMGQRVRAVEAEQQRQWQRIQMALDEQAKASREAAEKALHRQLEDAFNSQMKPLLDDLAKARRDCEAQTNRADSMSEELVSIRRALENFTAEQETQNRQLAVHTSEIERLKRGHEECARFRAEAQRQPVVTQPPPPPVISMPDVSPEAFAVLRNADGEKHELPRLQNTVGRAQTCDAVISYSQAISHRHASFDFDNNGRVSVRDLASRNGTLLNERRLPENAGVVVHSGDAIQFGIDGPTYTFEFGPAYYARWPREPVLVGPHERSGEPRMRDAPAVATATSRPVGRRPRS